MDAYEPQDTARHDIWLRLSPEAREGRLNEARRRLAAIEQVQARPEGESERAAVIRMLNGTDRSSFRRWDTRYREEGFDGLLDWRIAPASSMSEEVRVAIFTLRRLDPDCAVETILEHVAKHHGFETSATTVKRVLREAGLARRPGPVGGDPRTGEQRLELGGMKLVEAACVETGYLQALARGVAAHVEGLPEPTNPLPPDTAGRDEYGRQLPAYNERFRKGPDEAIGPGFASVEDKRRGMDPTRLQISRVSEEVLERKLLALLVSPLLGGGRWDGIRAARGELLEELCGLAYMPATLDRFTRELKYAGVSSTLWESHARLWLAQTAQWGEPRRAAVLYIDGTTKPVWTRLFSQSTKVSQVGRTMPGIEQIAFHTGYGVPLWIVSHSGRAPLVNEVPGLLDELGHVLGSSSVGRIVVIDAEANSIPFLEGLESGKLPRGWVTRLRPRLVEGKRIFNRTNYRAYRNGDRVRVGVADFNRPGGGKFRMRVVEVERRSTGKITYLGASTRLDEREWKAAELADLYFERWPAQEANFRAVNQAVGSKQVHGYGKRLVDNISVVTELDELAGKARRAEKRLARQEEEVEKSKRQQREEETLLNRRTRRQQIVGRHIAARVAPGKRITLALHKLIDEQRALVEEVAHRTAQLARREERTAKAEAHVARTTKRLAGYRDRQKDLESRRKIFAHDVELDSLFSLMKVGLTLLVTYVFKEYLGDACMEVRTFLERVATLPARLRVTSGLEIVTFEYNRRDPDVMALLQAHCEAINARALTTRSGKTLRLQVEDGPQPIPSAPAGSRTGSGDRFKR